jgi:hypothetical protein
MRDRLGHLESNGVEGAATDLGACAFVRDQDRVAAPELLQELVEMDNGGMVWTQSCMGAYRTFKAENRPTRSQREQTDEG